MEKGGNGRKYEKIQGVQLVVRSYKKREQYGKEGVGFHPVSGTLIFTGGCKKKAARRRPRRRPSNSKNRPTSLGRKKKKKKELLSGLKEGEILSTTTVDRQKKNLKYVETSDEKKYP